MKRLTATALAVLTLSGTTFLVAESADSQPSRPTASGRVIDQSGEPIDGALVRSLDGAETRTAADGSFALALAGPELVAASAAGHLDRTQALAPGEDARIVLTQRGSDTISLRFGGDVMAGRRFYQDLDGQPALLPADPDSADHAALLDQVRPLLADADLTVVNLETPLVDQPTRTDQLHPTKELAFASSTALADGLRASGVDLVALGNNHVTDALDAGLASTIEALERAGIAHVGAGRTVDEAWAPAVMDVRGHSVAFLSCTTIAGDQHAIPYVATATEGGAARCDAGRLADEVQAAGDLADSVVVLIHGGVEYQREQTAGVQGLFTAAADAGADLIVGSHPHVVGKIHSIGTTVVAESMGNLLFDQTLWDTYPSYLLRTDLEPGRVVSTSIDPILLDHYRPTPVTGPAAEAIRAIAADAPSGPEGGADLLFGTGSFQPMDTNPDTPPAQLWRLGQHATVGTDPACGPDGLSLVRSPLSTKDVVATIANRAHVTPGSTLTLQVDVCSATSGGQIELRWYDEASGPSIGLDSVVIPEIRPGSSGTTVELRAEVPAGAIAVQPFIRVQPTSNPHLAARVQVEQARLWEVRSSGLS